MDGGTIAIVVQAVIASCALLVLVAKVCHRMGSVEARQEGMELQLNNHIPTALKEIKGSIAVVVSTQKTLLSKIGFIAGRLNIREDDFGPLA